MGFYRIRLNTDIKVTGASGDPQVEFFGAQSESMYEAILHFFDSRIYFERSDYVPDPAWILRCSINKKAKLNDFVSFSPNFMGCPFIIREKVKFEIEKYNLGRHYYIPVELFDKSILVDEKYFLFFSPLIGFEIIDFTKSLFYSGNEIVGKRHVIVNDAADYVSRLRDGAFVTSDNLVLSNNFDKSLDLFKPRFDGIYGSERLVKHLLTCRFTGIVISEQPRFVFS
ncbi:MAG TPA: hypothetical protein VFE50_04690 [Cyclobacteriaceae bacterium]|nr:hypothetical protein [Cyclobacteriaceae bacterium]